MSKSPSQNAPSLSELPDDELINYGQDLGLDLEHGTPRGELLRLIRQRQELLLELDRDALLDIVVWGRCPVRKSASKEALARHISRIQSSRFGELGEPGLQALARLRGISTGANEPRANIETRLKKADGWRGKIRRVRRSLMGQLITKVVDHKDDAEYKFLPEAEGTSLRETIETEGVVGGIARKLRGVADDYVKDKLDEIELRIDRKLDEIDQRLGEWRDREVANRLKMLKLTLLFSILVALISLGYDYALRSDDGKSGPANSTKVIQPVELDDPGQLSG